MREDSWVEFDDIKPKCGVYKLTDKEGKALYIGRSVNILMRLMDHKKYKKFEKVFWIPCKKYASERLELEMIMRENPPLNANVFTIPGKGKKGKFFCKGYRK